MNEQKIVQASLQKIFNLNGYSNSEFMTQRDYEHISAEIEKKSGIVISGITIKRLSNGAFSRSPQIATLNAFGQQTSNKKDRNNLKDRQSNLLFLNVLIINLSFGFCSGYLRTSLPDTKCALD